MAKKTIHNDAATLARYIGYEIEYAARLSINDAANALKSSLNEATKQFKGGSTKFTQGAFTVSKFAKKRYSRS